MKPSEWFDKQVNARCNLQATHPHLAWYPTKEDKAMYAKILALLEAVEGAKTWRRPSMGGYEDFEAQSEESIIRAALAFKEKA